MRRAFFWFPGLALALAACGGKVVADAPAAGGSGGGTSSSSSSSSTAASSSGGSGSVCGGKAGIPCGVAEYCQFSPSTVCGNFDATGTCQPKPTTCDADCPGVCGCDGLFYCNACLAHAAGTDTNLQDICPPPPQPDSYRAASLYTNLPRYVIYKQSPSRSLCFQLTVELGGGSTGISGAGWGVTSIVVTQNPDDCNTGPGKPPGQTGPYNKASDAGGMLSLTSMGSWCTTGIHAKASFPASPGWMPFSEPFDADSITIEGGCP